MLLQRWLSGAFTAGLLAYGVSVGLLGAAGPHPTFFTFIFAAPSVVMSHTFLIAWAVLAVLICAYLTIDWFRK